MHEISNLFTGKSVRLSIEEPQTLAESMCRWERDTEYYWLLNDEPAQLVPIQKMKDQIEGDFNKRNAFLFGIRTLEDDRLIGFAGLWACLWNQGDSWTAIGLGERSDWGKGYGTDAMQLILQYAFTELNLRRVTLGVFEYNGRALRSYEKAGFQMEGRQRKEILRFGQRWDLCQMGILRQEWLDQKHKLAQA